MKRIIFYPDNYIFTRVVRIFPEVPPGKPATAPETDLFNRFHARHLLYGCFQRRAFEPGAECEPVWRKISFHRPQSFFSHQRFHHALFYLGAIGAGINTYFYFKIDIGIFRLGYIYFTPRLSEAVHLVLQFFSFFWFKHHFSFGISRYKSSEPAARPTENRTCFLH